MKDEDCELGFDGCCPNGNSRNIMRETESEYSSGRYTDYWDASHLNCTDKNFKRWIDSSRFGEMMPPLL
ncbi:MAG: hypothetical protein ACC656_05635, partial [Candidatus Heimdallarchaeota archaeon]